MNAQPHISNQLALRLQLLANGYEPVLVAGKAAVSRDWQRAVVTAESLASEELLHPHATNTGLRTGHLLGFDNDFLDADQARAIGEIAIGVLGWTDFQRYGAKPAPLLLYRCKVAMRKITLRARAPGADQVGTVFEVLGEGQQFVAYGPHKDTGQPYRWEFADVFNEPAECSFNMVPEVAPVQVRELVRLIRAKLAEWGYTNVSVSDLGAERERPLSRVYGEPVPTEKLKELLSYLDPNAPRDEWRDCVAAIRATPILDDPDENERREIAHQYSRGELDRLHRYDAKDAELYDAEAVDQVFDTMPPKEDGVGFGTLVKRARDAGFTGHVRGQSPQELFSGFVADEGPIPFANVLARVVPPVKELVPGLIEHGIPTFLSAPGGSHKSRLALQWGLSISAGVAIFGRPVERATFLHLSAEDHADEVSRRAQAITQRLQLPSDCSGWFWDRVGKVSHLAVMQEGGAYELLQFYYDLRERLRAIDGHKFLVLDSCYDFVRFAGRAKIDEGAVNAFIKTVLQQLCTETGTTLLALWHPSQSGQERGDASGWSVAWHNAPRARLSVTPVKDSEDAFELKVEKRNHGPKGKPLTLHWSDGVLLPRSESATAEGETQLERAVVRVAIMAAECGAPLTTQKRLTIWQLNEIENDIGRRPTQTQIKETLAAALPRGTLRYIRGSDYRAAGYYPPEMERAEEMAREAKRAKREANNANRDENRDENPVKTTRKTTMKTG
jgi:hypothetical protein